MLCTGGEGEKKEDTPRDRRKTRGNRGTDTLRKTRGERETDTHSKRGWINDAGWVGWVGGVGGWGVWETYSKRVRLSPRILATLSSSCDGQTKVGKIKEKKDRNRMKK